MGGIWDALSRAIITSKERTKVENGTIPVGAAADKKEQ